MFCQVSETVKFRTVYYKRIHGCPIKNGLKCIRCRLQPSGFSRSKSLTFVILNDVFSVEIDMKLVTK